MVLSCWSTSLPNLTKPNHVNDKRKVSRLRFGIIGQKRLISTILVTSYLSFWRSISCTWHDHLDIKQNCRPMLAPDVSHYLIPLTIFILERIWKFFEISEFSNSSFQMNSKTKTLKLSTFLSYWNNWNLRTQNYFLGWRIIKKDHKVAVFLVQLSFVILDLFIAPLFGSRNLNDWSGFKMGQI